MQLLRLFSLLLGFAIISESRNTYEGFSLFRITPRTQSQLQYLLKLNANTSSGLDFWLRTTAVNKSADVMVYPSEKDRYVQEFGKKNISFTILIPDLGRLIEKDLNATVRVPEGLEFFSNYQAVEDMHTFMFSLEESYPSIVRIIEIGSSFEGRPLLLLKISSGSDDYKPAIFIQGGAHAREMIGPPVVLFIAMMLATPQDTEIYALIESFDWFLYPIVNPDGYEHARTKDRLWRKTRSINEKTPHCFGVDANRNWDFHWNGTLGASTNPCSHNYAGISPFSEPETRAIADFMKKELKERLYLFLDFHNYSQRWLTPWGYTSSLPTTYDKQKKLAEVATTALEKVYGTKYSVGSSGNIMYTVTGGARDWVHGVMDAPFSYVIEVRDMGEKGGFLLPRDQILPTVEETWVGVKAMAKTAASEMRE